MVFFYFRSLYLLFYELVAELPSLLFSSGFKAEGLFNIFPWALAAIALVCISTLSDNWLKKGYPLRKSRSYIIIVSQFCAALLILPIFLVQHVKEAIFFISLALASGMSSNAVIYAVNIDVAKKYLGRSLGIMDTFFALSGILVPMLTGAIVQVTGSFYGAFGLLSILALSSVLWVAIFHQPDKAEKAIC